MARPFEDTPNSVLRRVLGLGEDRSERADGPPAGPNGAGPASPPKPPKPGEELREILTGDLRPQRNPQEAFRRPILEAVEELGGTRGSPCR